MNRKFVWLATLTLLVLGIATCKTVPQYRVAQPWMRTLQSEEPLPLAAKLKLAVSGETEPLLGSDELTAATLGRELAPLLKRRGYTISTAEREHDYTMKLDGSGPPEDHLKINLAPTASVTPRMVLPS